MMINYDEAQLEYVRNSLFKDRLVWPCEVITGMEEYARDRRIPISNPETMRFIEVLCRIGKFERILEIGTAIGYSAICIALSCAGVIDSIEIDDEMFQRAKDNIAKAGLEDRISVYRGDANKILPELTAKYDMIFVDGAKGQYLKYLSHCLRLLDFGGVLLSDNVLYNGMIANDDLVKKRKITIVKRMREYVKALCESSELKTSLLTLGDGLAVSYKLTRN